MKNNLIIAFMLGVLLMVAVIFIYNGRSGKQLPINQTKDDTLQVVASFYPLYFFAGQIGKDKIHITNITPAGSEPHDYEPSTQDITRIQNASVLIINGGNLEAWSDKVTNDVSRQNKEIVIASDGLIPEDSKDPHIWLDPQLAKKQAQRIAQSFIKLDPSQKAFFETNLHILENKFDALDIAFREGLKNCSQSKIVTSHDALGYLAKRYGFTQMSISGFSPDEEPSAKKLSEISEFAKINNVKYIFFESLISPKLSETIAKEIGARTIVFNPLEGLTREEEKSGMDYFSIQRDNLKNLRIALECI